MDYNLICQKAETVMVKCLRNIGNILVDKMNKDKNISFKNIDNPVTDIDLIAEKMIIETIKENFEDHSILSEEKGYENTNGEYVWVIDPIDGTVNYIHKIPFFSISIALMYKGRIVFGIIYDPVNRDMFTAISKQGTFVNGKRCVISNGSNIKQALLGTAFAYNSDKYKSDLAFALFRKFMEESQTVRRMGSTALQLAWTASGILDGFWVLGNKPWDFMAGVLLVREAGGFCKDIFNDEISLRTKSLFAGNRFLKPSMTKIISEVLDKTGN